MRYYKLTIRACSYAVLAILVLTSAGCSGHYYVPMSESSEGDPLAGPRKTAARNNVCTHNMQPMTELLQLLEARGHTLIALNHRLERVNPAQAELNCDVVVVLERKNTTLYERKGLTKTINVVINVLTLGLVPTYDYGHSRFVLQVISPAQKSNQRILVQKRNYHWKGWISAFVLHIIQSTGQQGRAQLDLNLKALAAIESVAETGTLRIEAQHEGSGP